ncbi:monosaccharide ABC transporter membrane protein (CUT2 family) [Microcella alkaliphila]|uniref:Monosaccharide ABC transporter membrane protein (CUT2 family) n=1 Tax=Microcella alkaliphila TaxID=279828 RepID=A0A4Q7TZ73_9MICO|nr:ABC transporter permease [Microcella alkaliphila]RZT66466.1 monosaccharide ABC transporter membrane protein (CUT2 family) [Microcella alkaliphila]
MSATQNAPAQAKDDAADTRAVTQAHPIVRWLGSSGAWVLLLDIALIALFSIISPGNVFWSLQNLESMLLSGTVTLLLALGIAMLLGAGGIDLSVGANLVFSSVVAALTIQALAPNGVAFALIMGAIAAVLAGALFGTVNGIIIGVFDVNSLIATLGTTGLGLAAALLLTGGSDIGGMPAELQAGFGLNTLFGFIPLPFLVAIVAWVILWVVLRKTRFGSRTLAIGSLRLVASRAGVRVSWHILSLAVMTGVLAGISGFISLSNYGATSVSGHPNDALAAITAVVIGGTRLEGGRVSLAGTIWGTALSVILVGGLVIMGVPSFWQLGAVGFVLIVAVCLDRIQARRRPSL